MAETTADFTPTQARSLAPIHAYIGLHGYPPAESEIAAAMCISPPLVNHGEKPVERGLPNQGYRPGQESAWRRRRRAG